MTEYSHRSLGYLRVLLHDLDGPRYPSALAAGRASTLHQGPAPIGAFVWFANEPFGDVGLAVGDGLMLGLMLGKPVVHPIYDWHHDPVGWSYHIGPDP